MPIPLRYIYLQVIRDLVQKDSHRGVTFTYAWLANQFGHFSLGAIPVFMILLLLEQSLSEPPLPIVVAIAVSLFWLLFELDNAPCLPLRRRRHPRPRLPHAFRLPWKNIAFDLLTDLCFFWLGAFLACAVYTLSPSASIVSIVLGCLLVFLGHDWYETKIYLQNAQYPFQMRLCDWRGGLDDEAVSTVNAFINDRTPGRHLILRGAARTGKTRLSIGMATEISLSHTRCTYTSAMKLFPSLFEHRARAFDATELKWNWREAPFLIIDDINPGQPVRDEVISPERFLELLDTYQPANEVNRQCLRDKSIIWVIGDTGADDLEQRWQDMLRRIGVGAAHIQTIALSLPADASAARCSGP